MWTSSWSCTGLVGGRPGEIFEVCGARQWSMYETWWTQEMVQLGAQVFSVRNSRCTSWRRYSDSGVPGQPRCCEQ